MKYQLIKLEKPIFRSGRRKFNYKIIRLDSLGTTETIFLFEDKRTAEQTLEKLE